MKQETNDASIEKPQLVSKGKSGAADLSLASLSRPVSPPPVNPRRRLKSHPTTVSLIPTSTEKSESAKVEAGEVDIDDHVSFFSSKLLAAARPPVEGEPRLSHREWLALYHHNLNDRGCHFVVHQHDHPVAGTHYDLRLQCNATSSISFALPYGLPGNPNSRRLNRFAIETRVHNLWNHLIETGSYETGTMLLWDTGEFEVLPYESSRKSSTTDYATATEESGTDSDGGFPIRGNTQSEPEKLHHAFQNRKIKLRLNGTRLPKNYVITIRLLQDNNRVVQPDAPAFKRRRTNGGNNNSSSETSRRKSRPEEIETSSDSSRNSSPTPVAEGKLQPNSPPSVSEDSPRTPSPTGESFHSLDRSPPKRKSPPKLKRSVSSLLRTASPPPVRRASSAIQSQGQPRPRAGLPRSTSTAQTLSHSHSQVQHPAQSPPPRPTPSCPPKLHPSPSTTTKHLDDSRTEVDTDTDTATTIRAQNAYPGALNTINSIHQRKWFLSLDRAACGFRATNEFAFGKRVWERPVLTHPSHPTLQGNNEGERRLGGFETFYVLGRDVERSVLTGRLASDVAGDEGLVGYKPRGGWKGITD
ncbi:hypothetical protein H2200_010570 [Cladophialophora chaetospira]|uniref:DNA ligase D 3'-phosphoesterase domain-containing protein n=1 Tax=Cladophialophora chaetospira TaxID=386627 RepID=A0AA39CE94_9EURO|nr:hypothetical protein H2200_010570 [Cladophialophora chaetospira]